MRRYQKWLSLGLLALTPGITLGGPLNSPLLQSSTSSNPQMAAAQKPAKPNANQKLAEKVQAALKKAKIKEFEIEIEARDGVVTLDGMVSSVKQRELVGRLAKVSGVTRVNNRLRVADSRPRMPVQQAAASMPRAQLPPAAVRQAAFQGGIEGPDPIQASTQPPPLPPPGMGPSGMPASQMPPPSHPVGGGSHAIYNQPNFPNYSWPTYAQYPNYAAVTYPSQYAAPAWPYIGPFYPYPQVPLGWRKATLEWDAGYWNLNFRARTDRWWWFLDPKNW